MGREDGDRATHPQGAYKLWCGASPTAPTANASSRGADDKTAKVWDAKTGTELLPSRGIQTGVNSVAYSPDGQRLVTGSYDKTAKVWDAKTGTELLTLKGHTNYGVERRLQPRRPTPRHGER
jgi:WD40 repeat protein